MDFMEEAIDSSSSVGLDASPDSHSLPTLRKLRQYKDKISVHLAHYDVIVNAQKKTGVDKFYLFLAVLLVVYVLLYVIGGPVLIFIASKLLYPAYVSYAMANALSMANEAVVWQVILYCCIWVFFQCIEVFTDFLCMTFLFDVHARVMNDINLGITFVFVRWLFKLPHATDSAQLRRRIKPPLQPKSCDEQQDGAVEPDVSPIDAVTLDVSVGVDDTAVEEALESSGSGELDTSTDTHTLPALGRLSQYKDKISTHLARYDVIVSVEKKTGVDKFYLFFAGYSIMNVLLSVIGYPVLAIVPRYIYPAYVSYAIFVALNLCNEAVVWQLISYCYIYGIFQFVETTIYLTSELLFFDVHARVLNDISLAITFASFRWLKSWIDWLDVEDSSPLRSNSKLPPQPKPCDGEFDGAAESDKSPIDSDVGDVTDVVDDTKDLDSY